MVENRVHPRMVVRLPAEYRIGGSKEWHQGTILDLSASGAALVSSVRLAPETLINLRFTLPADAGETLPAIEVESVILRAESEPASGGNVRYRAACHFLDLFGQNYELVRRYIFQRTQKARAHSSE